MFKQLQMSAMRTSPKQIPLVFRRCFLLWIFSFGLFFGESSLGRTRNTDRSETTIFSANTTNPHANSNLFTTVSGDLGLAPSLLDPNAILVDREELFRAAGEVSLLFNIGYLGVQGTNTNQANGILNLATLGISKIGFFQSDADGDGLFGGSGTQGNDLSGTIKIYFTNGTILTRAGAINWRETTGNKVEVMGFILGAGQANYTINYGNGQTFTIVSGTTPNSSTTIGLRSSFSTWTFTDGTNRSGNAATSGLLDALNAELTNRAQVATITVSPINVVEGNNLTYTVTLSKATPTQQLFDFSLTGAATSGVDYSATLTFSNGVVNNGDGTLSVPAGVTSFTITLPTIDDALIESTESTILSLGSISAVGNILDNDNSISVSSPIVNEASPTVVFEVSGTAGDLVSLALANGTTTNLAGLQYSTDGGATWVTYTSGTVALNSNGKLLVRTSLTPEQEASSDNGETLTLTATTSSSSAVGTGTIKDDGTGTIFNEDGTENTTAAKDDDRALTVNSITVNEGSPYAVFEVSGAAGQLTSLALANGTTTGLTGLEYFNGTAWVAYTSGTVALNSSGKLLVRTALTPEQEAAADNGETFTLTATNTGGTAAVGTGTIKDDGTGDYWAANNTTATPAIPTGVTLDDDRPLTVNSITVNEASPYAVFTVSGGANQLVTLALANGTATGPDYGPSLEYFNGTTWVAYTPGTQIPLDSTGKLLVRTPIKQDGVFEGSENFTLTATNTGGTAAVGTGTIKDDGTGTIFNPDGTENTTAPKDDDRVYPQPDVNATYLGIPLKGTIATNDDVPAGSTYGQPVPATTNPAGATLEMKPDGSYLFSATKPGVYTYTVPVCNAFGDCVTTTLTITVKDPGEPAAPILNTDLGTVRAGEAVAIQTLGNDAPGRNDLKLNPASVQVTVAPVNGVVTVDPVTGVITYTPNAGFVGKDVYTYTVCDTGNPALCSTAVQEITVLAADAPNTLTAADDFTTAPSGTILSGNVILNDGDLDKRDLKVTPQLVEGKEGVLKLNADGTFVFTPAKGFIGPVQFTYEVCSGGTTPICTNATLYLLVSPNDIEAVMDNFKNNEINGLAGGTAGNVLTNDLINGSPVKPADVVIAVKNNGGMTGVTINSQGNLIVPKGTPPGSYVITYTICDAFLPTNCSEAMVMVEVFHGVNLKITKDALSTSKYEGDQFEFSIKVENNGTTDASNVVASDRLDAGFSYVSSTITGATAVTTVTGQDVKWTFASLPAGAKAEIILRVKANPLTDGREKSISNTASVTSPARELSPNDNSSTTSMSIKPFFLANVITPNGDGKNDEFVINGLGKFASNELIIFDRWGSHIFQKKDYQNNWDAKGLVAGTYFYILSVVDTAGEKTEFKGWIQVIREE